MKLQLLVAATLNIAVLVGAVCTAPASAASISFIELSEGSTILLLTEGLGSFTASVGSESATVTVGAATATSVPLLSIGLTEQGSGELSDLISARAFVSGTALTGAYQVSFDSNTEGGLTAPPGVVTTLIPETGLPQVVFSGSLPLVGVDLTITALSDLDPVPEPATLLLFGSTIASLGFLVRRRGRQDQTT
jgi:hypothetical protein